MISSIDLSLIAAKMLSMYDDQGAHVIKNNIVDVANATAGTVIELGPESYCFLHNSVKDCKK